MHAQDMYLVQVKGRPVVHNKEDNKLRRLFRSENP